MVPFHKTWIPFLTIDWGVIAECSGSFLICIDYIFKQVNLAYSFISVEYIDIFVLSSARNLLSNLSYQTTIFFPVKIHLTFRMFLKLVKLFCNFNFHHLFWIKLWICLSLSLVIIWRHSKIPLESARKSHGFLWRCYKKRNFNFLMLLANLTQLGHLANKWGNLGHC